MYRIAIADDDPLFLQEAEAICVRTLDAAGLVRGEGFAVDCFTTAQALLAGMAEDCLLLLDVGFGSENGLRVAARLRSRSSFRLIYITSHREFVFDSFDTHPLHYLLKPLDAAKLSQLILDDLHSRYLDARLYLKSGPRHLSVPFRDIRAVESAQHRVLLHLRDRAEEWKGSLRALAPQLPPGFFCQCHNSYFINLSHVTELVRYEAKFDNGLTVPVSKRFYKFAIEQYIAFLRK